MQIQTQTLKLTPDTQVRPHSIIKHIPTWSDEDPRYVALRESVHRNGIVDAIKMTASHQIIDPDSRERYRAAQAWQLTEIPVQIVPDDQVATTALDTLLHRRHLTKGQRAYLAVPLIEFAFEEGKRKKIQNLQKGQQIPESALNALSGKTSVALAESLGVGSRLLEMARKLHNIYAENPEYRDQTEVMLLADTDGGEQADKRPMSLHGAIAGFAGKVAPQDHRNENNRQMLLFEDGLNTLRKRLSYWDMVRQNPTKRSEATREIESIVEQMPDDLRDIWSRALKTAKQTERA